MVVHVGGRGPGHMVRTPLGPVIPPTPAAPVNTALPVISGIQTQGQTLSVSNGSWTGYPAPTYAYQWASSPDGSTWTNIGTNAATYLLTSSEVGKVIRCIVTATNSQGAASATSASTGAIAAPLTISGTPGTTANVGSSYSFTPTTAGGHTPKVFSIVNKPSWASFSTSTGALTGTPSGAETDTSIVISVTDTDGLTASLASFTITVSAAPASLISSINGPTAGPVGADTAYEGWTGEYVGTPPTLAPDSAPQTISVTRQGFDTSGNATTYADTLTLTQRVRQPYPSSTSSGGAITPSYFANRVALSDYPYPGDAPAGVTNNTTLASPKPVANWAMPHRSCITNSIPFEIVAFHRDARGGQQVACVIVTATDGTNTVSATVSTPTKSTRPTDKNPIIVYAGTLNTTSLSDNSLITVNAKVYPWFGAAATSVADSSTSTELRGFSPRYFLKNTTRAASPPVCFVNASGATYNSGGTTVSIGTDATGVWSTNPTTAKANAFATIQGAIQAGFRAAGSGAAVTGGLADNCIIYCGPGTTPLTGAATGLSQNVAYFTITRDPNVTRGGSNVLGLAASVTFSIINNITAPLTGAAVRFTDIMMQRTAAATIGNHSTKSGELIWDDVDVDNGSLTLSWLSTGNSTHNYIYGMTMTNATGGSPFGASSVNQQRIMRGLSVDLNFGSIEGWFIVGSNITRCGSHQTGISSTNQWSGSIMAFNKYQNPYSGGGFLGPGGNPTVGMAIVQNLFENCASGSYTAFSPSADGATGDITHMIVHNNTYTGFYVAGRGNILYDDGATARFSKLCSFKGNIHTQINTKNDMFVAYGESNPTAAPTRIMDWAYYYGVGCQGEFCQFLPGAAGGETFHQTYYGLGAKIGLSTSVRLDPLWTTYAGTIDATTAGAGGGVYTLQGGSPCRSMVSSAVLPYDLAGNARATTSDHCGAYAA